MRSLWSPQNVSAQVLVWQLSFLHSPRKTLTHVSRTLVFTKGGGRKARITVWLLRLHAETVCNTGARARTRTNAHTHSTHISISNCTQHGNTGRTAQSAEQAACALLSPPCATVLLLRRDFAIVQTTRIWCQDTLDTLQLFTRNYLEMICWIVNKIQHALTKA